MYDSFKQLVEPATHILVIQAENPDGDSLGSALGLEEILGDLGKKVTLYCPVDMPKYLRYAKGWDRVVSDMPRDFDAAIIVDTASHTLLGKALTPQNTAQLKSKPLAILDHHITEGDIPLTATTIADSTSVATGELIYKIATALDWTINPQAAENLVIAILSDSLGLTTDATTAHSIHTVGNLVELGAVISDIDARRREFGKKSPEILLYKAKLIEKIEYHCDGQLALVHIPWDEIEAYSDQYNPSMLVMDEMRLVEGVRIAVALKTYPDGKITGKLRANPSAKVAETVAGFFGGGGHPFAAGFRVYDDYEKIKHELIGAVDKILQDYDRDQTS
ncbi:MAG TPA: DHH family phosphoesterase [Candidatus Saccharimonadales bacterium]|nr:DHH family phosphoesterase [Candidatus Saccharimonadales bacterium]